MHRCFNFAPPVYPVPLDFLAPALHIAPVIGHRCIRGLPVRPVLGHRFNRCWVTGSTGATVSAELIQFSISLSSFFVFCFAWSLYFIPGIYNYSLDKLISSIDCVVTQSPKSQNNDLMGPFSLQSRPPPLVIDDNTIKANINFAKIEKLNHLHLLGCLPSSNIDLASP